MEDVLLILSGVLTSRTRVCHNTLFPTTLSSEGKKRAYYEVEIQLNFNHWMHSFFLQYLYRLIVYLSNIVVHFWGGSQLANCVSLAPLEMRNPCIPSQILQL